jgi:membrane-bound ClpP family serine protease
LQILPVRLAPEQETRVNEAPSTQGGTVIVLGVILLVLGLLVPALHVLLWIGIVLLVIGAVLALMGTAGREIGGRRHWY